VRSVISGAFAWRVRANHGIICVRGLEFLPSEVCSCRVVTKRFHLAAVKLAHARQPPDPHPALRPPQLSQPSEAAFRAAMAHEIKLDGFPMRSASMAPGCNC